MKNRFVFKIAALVITIMLCMGTFSSCAQNTEEEPLMVLPEEEISVEGIRFERIMKYDEEQDLYVEYAVIMGVASEDEVLWTHITDKYPCGQLDMVEEVLATGSQYVYAEDGTLVSLDCSSGEVLWKNREKTGYGVKGIEGENGDLYFCAYQGAAFLVVDSRGDTLHKIESFGQEYNWAYDIRMEDGKVAVVLEHGPSELRGPEGFVFFVDPSDYSFMSQYAYEEQKCEAMGHKWEQITETDYVETNVITYSQCTVCKKKENQDTSFLMTLVSDDGKTFHIPPAEYSNRLSAIFTAMDFDMEYSWVAQDDDMCIEIRENGELCAMVFFYKDRSTYVPERITGKYKDKEGAFGSIQLVMVRECSEPDGLLTAFVAACEPLCGTDPDLAYEIVKGAVEYRGEEVVYPYGSLVYLFNVLDSHFVMNAYPPQA